MKRQMILNWNEAHHGVNQAIEAKVESPWDLPDTGKGWTYVTFCPPGTDPQGVLFDIDQLEELAKNNGYHLSADVVAQHNKLVVTAIADSPSSQLFGLVRLLEAYGKRYADTSKHPDHTFYGKLGGQYDRAEKGRVLAIYARDDEALLAISEAFEALVETVVVPGVTFTTRLANGLSAMPRMLHGFDDPTYRGSGVTVFRITDPTRFEVLLDQARADYPNYQFTPPHPA
jgi:hypothetical protein